MTSPRAIVALHLERSAATKGTVDVFLTVLTSKITQDDQAAMRRSQKPGSRSYWNPHALPLMLGQVQKVKDAMRSMKDRDDPEALGELKNLISRHFNKVTPVNRTLKQIDDFLQKGLLPSLVRV